jgi:hypothetical protein
MLDLKTNFFSSLILLDLIAKGIVQALNAARHLHDPNIKKTSLHL